MEDFLSEVNVEKLNAVIQDPSGRYWQGAVVSASEARDIVRRGGATIPVNPELFRRSAVAGFFFRPWGGGWPLDPTTPRHMCPVLLHTEPQFTRVHWRARVVEAHELVDGVPSHKGEPSGFLRFVSDSGQAGATAGGVSSVQVDLRELGPAVDGGWNIGGSAALHSVGHGFYGFALYGMGRNTRISYIAASQT